MILNNNPLTDTKYGLIVVSPEQEMSIVFDFTSSINIKLQFKMQPKSLSRGILMNFLITGQQKTLLIFGNVGIPNTKSILMLRLVSMAVQIMHP